MNSGNGLQTSHSLNFSGGTERNRYLLSTSYLSQNGILGLVEMSYGPFRSQKSTSIRV
jgi:hypothetical protein